MPSARKRTLEIEVLVDDKEVRRRLGNIDQSIQKTGTAFSNAAKLAASAFAVDTIKDFAREAINQYSDLNESVNAVNVTFGRSADGIKKLGQDAAEAVGLSNAEFNQLAVGFAAFADSISGGSGTDQVQVIDDLTTRIADFASVMNLDVPEAADKFRSGLAGETEPLRKFGIDVSAAAVNSKALELGLAGSTSELTEQDKVLARYELIMEQTEKTAGDFANTSADLANQQRILNAQWEDTQAVIGEQLAPAFNEALDAGRDLLTVMDAFLSVLPGVEKTGDLIGRGFNNAFFGIPDLLDQIASWFTDEEPEVEHRTASFGSQTRLLGNEFVDTADKALLVGQGYGEAGQAAADAAVDTELLALQTRVLKDAEERQKKSTDAARDAILKKRAALREVHNPLFRAVGLSQELAEAEAAVAKAVEEHGAASSEAFEASSKYADLSDEMIGILTDLKDQGIDPTGAAARTMLDNLGIPDAVIDALFAQFDEIQANWENRVLRTRLSAPNVDFRDGSWVKTGSTSFVGHQGGVVPGVPGEEVPAILQAGETVTRRSEVGHTGASVLQNVYVTNPSSAYIAELLEIQRRQ